MMYTQGTVVATSEGPDDSKQVCTCGRPHGTSELC